MFFPSIPQGQIPPPSTNTNVSLKSVGNVCSHASEQNLTLCDLFVKLLREWQISQSCGSREITEQFTSRANRQDALKPTYGVILVKLLTVVSQLVCGDMYTAIGSKLPRCYLVFLPTPVYLSLSYPPVGSHLKFRL